MIANVIPETEWEIQRRGCLTSSEIHCIMTDPKLKSAKDAGELSEGAKTYCKEKLSELLTGTVRVFSSHSTDFGNHMESLAAAMLKEIYPDFEYFGTNNKLFIPFIHYSGGSPDGVSDNWHRVFEVKCPENPANHIDYLMLKTQDDLKGWCKDYYAQIQMNMLVVSRYKGIQFEDMIGEFVSYGSLFDERIRLHRIELAPDMEFADKLMQKLDAAFEYMRRIRDLLLPKDENV